jgi:hypothetical protein
LVEANARTKRYSHPGIQVRMLLNVPEDINKSCRDRSRRTGHTYPSLSAFVILKNFSKLPKR